MTTSEKFLGVGVLILALIAGGLFGGRGPVPAPYFAQPSVPSYIPPQYDGRCLPLNQPIVVECPYCRNRISVSSRETGKATGAFGATVPSSLKPSAAK